VRVVWPVFGSNSTPRRCGDNEALKLPQLGGDVDSGEEDAGAFEETSVP